MLIKLILVGLMIAMMVSLTGAFKGLTASTNQTFFWLAIRVSLAVAILIVIVIGLVTDQLTIGAPWSGRY